MRFKVSWGSFTDTVEARSSADAWSQFCQSNPEAYKFPNLFPREVQPEPEPIEEVVSDDNNQ